MKKLILLAAMLAMMLVGAVPALAQSTVIDSQETNPPESDEENVRGTVSGDQGANPPGGNGGSVRGTITDISGSVVLVEEDPSAESGPKGYFTVTPRPRSPGWRVT